MKRNTFLSLSLVTFLIVGCQENFDSRLQREAREYTEKHCPYEVEVGNTLDSTTYDLTTRKYTRWYTLTGKMDHPQVHHLMMQHLGKIKHGLLEELRGDTQWETCKENGIFFEYVYRSKKQDKELFRFILTPSDYQR